MAKKLLIKKHIEEYCKTNELQLLFIDGADSCLIGIGHSNDAHYLIYDKKKYINLLKKTMGEKNALEWFFYNVLGSSLSGGCIFLETL